MNIDVIGRNALRLWHIMNTGTYWRYKKLREVSHLSDREINAALGWLAREDTIEIKVDPITNSELYKARNFWETAGF